ncbi:MAG: protein-L-isoaspartate(D-aspartate) O-methyltransferase [SAR324 cluster bacterium]|nr:protein-L-isoaspartate(D-aspartate) O-methyltransferase [SAR324 cluster bacterium]
MFQSGTRRWPEWIERQLVQRGIDDERVLSALAKVPREAYVPRRHRNRAYFDGPIKIGCHQTISQPFIVALSLQALKLDGSEKVLDIGTGSGYQAVLLSHLAREVYTIEIHQKLFIDSRQAIQRHQLAPVHQRHGDGSQGWPEAAPFDAIVAGARAPKLPEALTDQLVRGGRLVIPIGGESAQMLYRVRKSADGSLDKQMLERVLFVPLVGKGGTGFLPD